MSEILRARARDARCAQETVEASLARAHAVLNADAAAASICSIQHYEWRVRLDAAARGAVVAAEKAEIVIDAVLEDAGPDFDSRAHSQELSREHPALGQIHALLEACKEVSQMLGTFSARDDTRRALLSPDCDMQDMFSRAVCAGDVDLVRLLLLVQDPRIDPTKDSSMCMYRAVEAGDAAVVGMLLRDGRADPAACDNACLNEAARKGYADVVRLLLQDGRADPTADESACLTNAAFGGFLTIVDMLLRDGRADPTKDCGRCLRCAVLNGHADVFAMLLADGRANPAEEDWEPYWEPLSLACYCGHSAIVALLLQDGRTCLTRHLYEACLIIARERCHDDIVALLISRRAL
jgi:hypothetical protein